MSGPLICIYHGGCPDGFTSAWIVARSFGSTPVRLVEGRYGEPPPADVDGANVYIVDFSYPRDQLLDLAGRAATVTVLDHHKSAQEDLAGLDDAPLTYPTLCVEFDMDRSGAGITWDHFHPDDHDNRPWLVNYVEDRDLWRFKLPWTHEAFAAVSSHPNTLEAWDEIASTPFDRIVTEGRAVQRFRQKLIDTAVEGAIRVTIAGHDVPVANVPYAVGSDVAGELAKGEPFAAYWYESDGERRWGLRSAPDGLDVAEIAQRFGGGGHKHAAGYKQPSWAHL